jgi:hypothetical protein
MNSPLSFRDNTVDNILIVKIPDSSETKSISVYKQVQEQIQKYDPNDECIIYDFQYGYSYDPNKSIPGTHIFVITLGPI